MLLLFGSNLKANAPSPLTVNGESSGVGDAKSEADIVELLETQPNSKGGHHSPANYRLWLYPWQHSFLLPLPPLPTQILLRRHRPASLTKMQSRQTRTWHRRRRRQLWRHPLRLRRHLRNRNRSGNSARLLLTYHHHRLLRGYRLFVSIFALVDRTTTQLIS